MEIVLIWMVVIMMLIMIASIIVSKQLSIMVFSIIFVGIVIAIINTQGFTQQSFGDIGGIGFIMPIVWVGLSKSILMTTGGHDLLEDRLSFEENSTCEACGKKLSYHKAPKNVKQILLGGLTCENCGAEFNIPVNIFVSR